mmetsp:Transcript_56835/g.151715  ORF Transcript_56835/g.151715 Transcript_56835/m.151715 type:complete len:211 (+) Transcript_56835:308-940(+)
MSLLVVRLLLRGAGHEVHRISVPSSVSSVAAQHPPSQASPQSQNMVILWDPADTRDTADDRKLLFTKTFSDSTTTAPSGLAARSNIAPSAPINSTLPKCRVCSAVTATAAPSPITVSISRAATYVLPPATNTLLPETAPLVRVVLNTPLTERDCFTYNPPPADLALQSLTANNVALLSTVPAKIHPPNDAGALPLDTCNVPFSLSNRAPT